MWKSPNGTIRAALDGTVFRAPIVVKGIEPCVRNWEKPITLARHAYGDVYKNTEIKVPGPGKAELVFTAEDGSEIRETIHNFTGSGILQGIHNTDESISSFAKACFNLRSRICGLRRRIRSPRNTTIISRIFSRRSMMPNIRRSSRRPASNISIP